MQGLLLTRLPLRGLAHTTRARCLATRPPTSSGPSAPNSKASSTPTPPPTSTSTPPQTESQTSAAGDVPPPTALSLDFSPAEEEEKQSRTGAKSSKDSLSSIERKRRVMGRVSLVMLGLGLVAGGFYLGREWEEFELKEKKMTIENAPSTRFARTKTRFMELFDYFNKPIWTELLPPPVPPPYQKPYTLLLSIDDLLVTSTWDRQNGWRAAKRPGVDYFLGYMAQFFEIVIFTSQNYYTAMPIIEKLDPYNFYITYKLFREATRSVDGKIVKDLSYLNRDLSKVIMMDTNPEHVSLSLGNSIIMPKWNGDPRDKGLVAMIPFLESIAIYKPPDVRPILTAYHGKDIPIEYAKKEAEGKRQFLEEWRKNAKGLSSGGFTLSSLFGGPSAASNSPEPLTYLEQKRKEAQQTYIEEQQYLTANKAHLDRLLEEDRQAAAAQMSGSLMGMIAGLSGGQPPQDKGKEKEKETKAVEDNTKRAPS